MPIPAPILLRAMYNQRNALGKGAINAGQLYGFSRSASEMSWLSSRRIPKIHGTASPSLGSTWQCPQTASAWQ